MKTYLPTKSRYRGPNRRPFLCAQVVFGNECHYFAIPIQFENECGAEGLVFGYSKEKYENLDLEALCEVSETIWKLSFLPIIGYENIEGKEDSPVCFLPRDIVQISYLPSNEDPERYLEHIRYDVRDIVEVSELGKGVILQGSLENSSKEGSHYYDVLFPGKNRRRVRKCSIKDLTFIKSLKEGEPLPEGFFYPESNETWDETWDFIP